MRGRGREKEKREREREGNRKSEGEEETGKERCTIEVGRSRTESLTPLLIRVNPKLMHLIDLRVAVFAATPAGHGINSQKAEGYPSKPDMDFNQNQ